MIPHPTPDRIQFRHASIPRAVIMALCLLLANMLIPGMAQAQKAFIRDDLATSSIALEERLKREVQAPQGANAATLVRQGEAFLARNEARRALPLLNQAVIADPRSSDGWRAMANAARAVEPRDYRERYELQERALSAAYLAYQRSGSKSDEGLSLRVLAQIFESREMWRPALTTYRLSLEAREDAATRTTFEKLRETRGFRVTENKTDADSASPRACFTFSEPLARGRSDFAPYVAVTGNRSETAVSAEGSQICVEGLKHGERYGIVLRQGLPSAVGGEALLKNADYEIYVRDRTPSVRFTGRNYVLPRTGQTGLPLVSVNTDKVALEILRIGERNLVNTVLTPDFLSQMSRFEVKELAQTRGQSVWSGSMDVKSELNRDVTTAFPVTEALGALKPGAYLLFATAGIAAPAGTDSDDSTDDTRTAAQWFVVSDIGLTSFTGSDGVHVLARSLADASVMRGVEVQLIARNNEVLGTATTDANGHARFDAGLARGKGGLSPGIVTARLGEDYGFLDVKQAAFDLTDRGVKGRVAPTGLDAFLYAERGVYRSGETVFLTSLLRDSKGGAVAGLPLTLVTKRPDGVEYRRQLVEDQGGGGRALSIPLVSGAASGTWRVQAFADPKGAAIGETSFLVEDYVPERLDVEAKAATPTLKSGEPAQIAVTARYLYGAPGGNLDISGQVTVRAASEIAIPGLQGYKIGLTDESVEATKTDIEDKAVTDAAGKAALAIPVTEPATTLPLEVEFLLSVSENGGRGVSRSVTLPILPKGNVIGVKALFADGSLSEGQNASFDVVMATGEGRRLLRPGVKWTLSRVQRNYQWFFQDGRWAYEASKTTRRVSDGEVAITTASPARIEARVDWGSYRLDVRAEGQDGAETSISFDVGYVAEAKADTPDVLDIALDKAAYADGEMMQIRLSPRFAGKATIAIVSDQVHAIQSVDMPAGGATIPVKVAGDWGASAYIVVLGHRPLDRQAQRMPGRAIGLSWFSINKTARALNIGLGAPAIVRPRGTLELPITIAGLSPGEQAYVTVAAVDIGILNLTRYAPPNPADYYFGQRQMGAELRDLYGYLIDGMQGQRGSFRSGGDTAAATTQGDKPTQEPLTRYSGIVKVGADGTAKVSFELPAFNGAVRVMGVAWTGNRVGQASADVIIRDPVVVQATLPRFLGIGDQSRFHVEINNVEGQAGDYTLAVDVKGPVLVAGDAAQRVIRLGAGQKVQTTIPVTGAGIGLATFGLRLTGPNQDLLQELRVRVQPADQAIANRSVHSLAAGGRFTLNSDLLGDMIPGSGSVSVAVSPLAALDVPGLLSALDRYPYGCTEQTVSRALPLLYVNRLASLQQLALDDGAETRIAAAIDKVLSRQGANGSFGLWGTGGEDLWLDAFVADFLTRARELKIAVPATGMNLALDRLRNQVTNAGEIRPEDAPGIAYALYVLARNGRPVMGDLRYLADTKLGSFASPLAKGQIAAALSLLGDRGRGRTVFAQATATLAATRDDRNYRADYGSKLRDGAGIMTLLAESGGERIELLRVSDEVSAARSETRNTSTQEQSWMVLAASATVNAADTMALTVDSTPQKGALYRTWRDADLAGRTIAIGNGGADATRLTLTVTGAPLVPLPELDRGFKVERSILTMKGAPANAAQLRQNERYVVLLKVTETRLSAGRLLLVDPLPAGLEIENANLTEAGNTEGLAFTKSDVTPVNTEARDDRFVAAYERDGKAATNFVAAYIVRAVTPGRYVQPSAAIEDMYRPDRYGRSTSGIVEVQAAR
jgi:alpha-2-macroglobulin